MNGTRTGEARQAEREDVIRRAHHRREQGRECFQDLKNPGKLDESVSPIKRTIAGDQTEIGSGGLTVRYEHLKEQVKISQTAKTDSKDGQTTQGSARRRPATQRPATRGRQSEDGNAKQANSAKILEQEK